MALLRRATPKPGAVRVTHVAPLGTAGVQGWDGEFESPLLQRGVSCEPDFRSESLDPRILA
jgi:hypothetical protein